MKTVKLFAGVPVQLGETGYFFRIFSASNKVNLRFASAYDGGNWSLETDLIAGVGLNFSNRPSPFTELTIVSDVDQIIEYWASIDSADDDRLSSSSTVTVNTTGSGSTTPPKKILNDTINGENVLTYSENRKTALLQLSDDCYVDSVTDGILVTGTIEWSNRGALKLIPVNAGVEVRILEEQG